MKRLTLTFLFFAVVLTAASFQVFAEDATSETPEPTKATTSGKLKELQQKKTALKDEIASKTADLKQKGLDRACEVITKNIESRTTRFDENKDKHLTEYKNMKSRIEKFITQLKAKGYDTTKLTADLAVLDTKIQKLATDYNTYITKLKDTTSSACGKSSGAFKTALEAARAQLKIVHDDAKDIHDYYRLTIRPDITSLKSQHGDKDASGSAKNKLKIKVTESPEASSSSETEK